MNRIHLRLAAALIAGTWALTASAQTTQPASPVSPLTWAAAVEQVAKATELGDVPRVASLLAHDAPVRSFDMPEQASARAMVDAAADWRLLGAHAYEFPPPSLAVDIATDVKASDLVPDVSKRKIIPIDDAEAARANTTAADWVGQTLAAERNHLVGVAVFWNAKANRPMFVLMKGQPAGDSYLVKLAVYGDPMAPRVR